MNTLYQIKLATQNALCAYQQKLNFRHPKDMNRSAWELQVSTHKSILELQRHASELAATHGYELWFTHGCPHLTKDGVDCLREMFDAEPDESPITVVAGFHAGSMHLEFLNEVGRIVRVGKVDDKPGVMNVVFAVALENLADRYMPRDSESKKLAKELRNI